MSFNQPFRPHYGQNPSCQVCGDSVTPSPFSTGDTTCGAIQCEQVMAKQGQMPAAMFAHHLEFQRKRILEAREHAKQVEEHKREIDEAEDRENQRILELVQERQHGDDEAAGEVVKCLVPLPSASSTLIPRDAERVQEYRQHLIKMITRAIVTDEANDLFLVENETKALAMDKRLEEQPELGAVSGHFCSLCKGGCCTAGENHGMLDVRGIRRFMDQHPEMKPAEVMQAYLERLPEESIEGSCINHTAYGCALPREMRSDVCNGYFCHSVKEYSKAQSDGKAEPALAVVRGYRNFRRYEEGADHRVREVVMVTAQSCRKIEVVNLP